MFLLQNLNKSVSYLTCLILLTAITGDYVVAYSKLHVFQALFDNATHFLIGGLSWLIVCLYSKEVSTSGKILEVVCCSLLSSFIDLDHFIEARSLNLKDATNLKRRPFLHCSTVPVLLCLLILLVGNFLESYTAKRCSLIVLTAFASHHTRDATRRGYWLYPFGNTAPIPYAMYIGLSCVLPHLVVIANSYFKISVRDYNALETTVI